MAGIVAGAQTQPAVLALAQERTSDQRVGLGYALVFPAAMVHREIHHLIVDGGPELGIVSALDLIRALIETS